MRRERVVVRGRIALPAAPQLRRRAPRPILAEIHCQEGRSRFSHLAGQSDRGRKSCLMYRKSAAGSQWSTNLAGEMPALEVVRIVRAASEPPRIRSLWHRKPAIVSCSSMIAELAGRFLTR
jgi:hypothetical protein